MARIRTIKPAFWTDEKIQNLSNDAALLFIGIWNFADDFGYFPLSPKALSLLMPRFRPCTIQHMVSSLEKEGLVRCCRGASVGLVVGWEHQQIRDRRASKWNNTKIEWDDPENDAPRSDKKVACIGRDSKGKERTPLIPLARKTPTEAELLELFGGPSASPTAPEVLSAKPNLVGEFIASYRTAFRNRYGIDPAEPHGKELGQIRSLVGRTPIGEACAMIQVFVQLDGDREWFKRKGHDLGTFFANANNVKIAIAKGVDPAKPKEPDWDYIFGRKGATP